jgi:adenylate cyclase
VADSSEELQQRLERVLLGGRRKYTRLEVAEKAGVPEERSRRLWRALGFATVRDDEVVFTDADVEAMRTADQLVQSGLIDPSIEVSVTRALGQHLSRLAEWQVDMLWELVKEQPELGRSERQVARLVDRLLPELERVQNFVWRRHLAAYAGRAFAAAGDNVEARTEVVGFVDMVGYTRLTRQIDEEELSRVLDAFELLAAETIAEHHGRVVKMIGDEVLFVADAAVDAAEIALALTERTSADESLPAVRAGMASGRILSRFGDVYGSVVNLAARLTSVARPGTILVDRELASELSEEKAYELRPRRPVTVRGYNRLRPAALRRASEAPTGMFASSQQLAAEMLGLTDPATEPAGEETESRSRRRRRRIR